MKTILVATHGTTLIIAGLTAMFGTPSDGFIGKASNVGLELRPEHIDLVVSDMAEIMASPQYKLWVAQDLHVQQVTRAPKAKASKTAASTSSTSRSGDAAPSRTRKRTRKPSTASTESSVNGAEANAGAPPHSLTMAEQEGALKEAYPKGLGESVLETQERLNDVESIGRDKPVKTRVRHRKPPKPRPVVVEHPEAVNS